VEKLCVDDKGTEPKNLADVFIDDFSSSDGEEESDFSDFDDETYVDNYEDWNDRSVASHGVTGEQGMSSHPNRQVSHFNCSSHPICSVCSLKI
jgi:hypothetical protein